MKTIAYVAAALAMAVAACTPPYREAPIPVNFPTAEQQKLQAAAHWNIIAEDVAIRIAGKIAERKPIFINLPRAVSPFERAFANLLASALSARNFELAEKPENAISIGITTQVVEFSPNRPITHYPGGATALLAGIYALHVGEATAGAVASAGIMAADAASWFHSKFATEETPQTEIIVTISIGDGTRYTKLSNIYYVTNADASLYLSGIPTTTISVKGGE